MRFSQANWISIDERSQLLGCTNCNQTIDVGAALVKMFGRRMHFQSFAFVRLVSRIARQHFSCPWSRDAQAAVEELRQESLAREIAATIAMEGEEIQRALEGHASVIPFARGVTTTSDAPGMMPRVADRFNPTAGRVPTDADPLCIHCGVIHTLSIHQVCGKCQKAHGLSTCKRAVAARAAGAGGVE